MAHKFSGESRQWKMHSDLHKAVAPMIEGSRISDSYQEILRYYLTVYSRGTCVESTMLHGDMQHAVVTGVLTAPGEVSHNTSPTNRGAKLQGQRQ